MLGVKVNWKAVKGTPMAATLVAMQAEQEAGVAKYIRMAGHSRSGPCAVCSQYFGMVHDKSGRTVPLVKLHRHCVCRDVNHKLASDLGKVPITPMKRFEWIEQVPVGAQAAILGKAKSALLEHATDKIGTLKQMVGRTKLKKVDTLIAMLKQNNVKELKVMGLQYGIKASELQGVSKEELVARVLAAARKVKRRTYDKALLAFRGMGGV